MNTNWKDVESQVPRWNEWHLIALISGIIGFGALILEVLGILREAGEILSIAGIVVTLVSAGQGATKRQTQMLSLSLRQGFDGVRLDLQQGFDGVRDHLQQGFGGIRSELKNLSAAGKD